MSEESVREQLRQACAEIDAACEEAIAADAEEYLTGVSQLLDYHTDEHVTDPEGHAYPPPGALDTIQDRLSKVIEETDDPAAERLQSARTQLVEARTALGERLNEGRPPSHSR